MERIKKAVIWALGEIQDRRAIEAIFQFAKDQDLIIRETAQAALSKLR